MKMKKRFLVGGVVLTAAALAFSGAFAWISGVQQTSNQFVLEDYNVKLHDVLAGTPVENGDAQQVKWTPGEAVDKDIWVSNDGSDDILVRVKLSETLKMRKGAETLLDVANVVHGSEGDTQIHEHVSWTTGNVKTYAEWQELTQEEQCGAYWVLADDGYAYWMQPLTPSGDEDTAGALGNTGLLVDAVTLAEGSSGAIEYTIDVEMDAIDAKLAGLEEDGATWTSDAAKALAAAATYDPMSSALERVDAALAEAETELGAARLQSAKAAYEAAAAAENEAVRAEKMHEGAWYELYAKVFEDPSNYGAYTQYNAQYIYSKTYTGEGPADVGSGDKVARMYDCTILMFDPVNHLGSIDLPDKITNTVAGADYVENFYLKNIADGAFQYVSVSKLHLDSLADKDLTAHTFDGLTVTSKVIYGSLDKEFWQAVQAGEYGTFANEPKFDKWS